MSKSRNIADIGSNDVLDTNANGIDVTGTVVADGLTVDGGTTNRVASFISTDANALIEFADDTTTNRPAIGAEGNDMTFSTNGEKVRIDSSGNALFGTTSTSSAEDGVRIRGDALGLVTITRNGNRPLLINRRTSDGDIIELQKNGSTVGSIGTDDGDLYIGTGVSGLQFFDVVPRIIPFNTSTGSLSDNTTDLGDPTFRFKDLYLSGGVYLGGTGAANHLDDYEEGTWTPATGDAGYTISASSGSYTKIGRVVHLWGQVQFSAVPANNSSFVFGVAPFTNTIHLGTGVVRDDSTTGAIYVFRIAQGSTNMEINSMDGVTAGSQRTLRTGENYRFYGSYYVA